MGFFKTKAARRFSWPILLGHGALR